MLRASSSNVCEKPLIDFRQGGRAKTLASVRTNDDDEFLLYRRVRCSVHENDSEWRWLSVVRAFLSLHYP
jgi:hypothetical protein